MLYANTVLRKVEYYGMKTNIQADIARHLEINKAAEKHESLV